MSTWTDFYKKILLRTLPNIGFILNVVLLIADAVRFRKTPILQSHSLIPLSLLLRRRLHRRDHSHDQRHSREARQG